MEETDDFFVDNEGWVVVCCPQHGHSSRLRKATEHDNQVYEAKCRKERDAQ